MKRIWSGIAACAAGAMAPGIAHATVFLNEIFTNPPGSLDDTREFIELLGTPGMKLDGYAVALLQGTQSKYFPLGSIPPAPTNLIPEIDEFFPLDGLALGSNGLLVIGIGNSGNYPTLLADTNFQSWSGLYSGPFDIPGTLENDGSHTYLLIRNRPGGKHVGDPDWRWAKDVDFDFELITPVLDTQTNTQVDQFGDGDLDDGGPDGMGGTQLDMRGRSTPSVSDDLEVVDEVSYEHDRGWEYDMDRRHVDVGSVDAIYPERRVHNLEDPEGYNPDALTRVDYRTKGPGWAPLGGGTGSGPGGMNWQDTATEQWIRGDTVQGAVSGEPSPQFFYDNSAAATNPYQPYRTNVPSWLHDGTGTEYNYGASNTYRFMAGRINPLAIPYIPGDADRDGVADANDIAKIAAVFGDDDWIFSNSFPGSPAGNDVDPATQTRPWDVDQTGDNGIECSDLQWTLNFIGNTNGQVVGRRYDSATPAASGVYLNSNAGVFCTVTTTTTITGGHALNAIQVGDTVQLAVYAQVTGGAITTAGQQNGVMQFIHDIGLNNAGVLRVTSVSSAVGFAKTRGTLESLQGASGDLGIKRANGYSTSFTNGVGSAKALYIVNLTAIGAGSAQITVLPSAEAKFAASTPRGLKVGHTDNNGNPGAAVYPAPLALTVVPGCLRGDANCDGAVNNFDIDPFVAGILNLGSPTPPAGYSGDANCWNQRGCWGDTNGDTAFNNFDIDPFVTCILNSPAPGQPCP